MIEGLPSFLCAQKTDFDFEVIIAGNTANLLPFPDIPSSRLKNIRYVDIGIVPPGHARNTAVSEASGEYIAFLDDDCLPCIDWLSALDRCFRTGAAIVGGRIGFPVKNYFSRADDVGSFFDQMGRISKTNITTVAALNLACTRGVWNKVGPFAEQVRAGEDLEWILRARRLGFRIDYDGDALAWHLGGRATLKDVLRHAALWGTHSIQVRCKFRQELYTPEFFFNPVLLLILSPIIGLLFSFRIILERRFRDWFALPIIALAKTAWAVFAAKSLLSTKTEQQGNDRVTGS